MEFTLYNRSNHQTYTVECKYPENACRICDDRDPVSWCYSLANQWEPKKFTYEWVSEFGIGRSGFQIYSSRSMSNETFVGNFVRIPTSIQ